MCVIAALNCITAVLHKCVCCVWTSQGGNTLIHTKPWNASKQQSAGSILTLANIDKRYWSQMQNK